MGRLLIAFWLFARPQTKLISGLRPLEMPIFGAVWEMQLVAPGIGCPISGARVNSIILHIEYFSALFVFVSVHF